MIPILFEKDATTFTTNGLGRLADCTRLIVTEERNGLYELEMDYPVSAPMFSEIQIGRIIVCTHGLDTTERAIDNIGPIKDENGNILTDENGLALTGLYTKQVTYNDIQPFDIVSCSKPIDGVVTFYAHHISYRLSEVVVSPFTAQNCSAAIAGLKTNSVGTNPFTFNTNKTTAGEYSVEKPTSLRALLGGEENSILDVYGSGEYNFDKFSVYLYTARGNDTDVSIRYGKNLAEYQDETDYSESYNAVMPYWFGSVMDDSTGTETETLVTLTEKYISSGNTLPNGRTVIIPMDLSSDFESAPTEGDLRTLATSRLSNSYGWLPLQNITVDFIQLWQTEEYKDFAPLQRVSLCDTVLVDVPMYGVSGLRIKVIKTVWNALLERYDEMELGSPQTTLADAIIKGTDVGNQIKELKQNIKTNSVVSGNTNQYFWLTKTGIDTGAHITEVDRETFLADPSAGGGNLIARSNGIAVRDGLTELATYASDGITFRDSNSTVLYKVLTTTGSMQVKKIYNQAFTIDNVNNEDYISLGRTINQWTSIELDYKVDSTSYTASWNSLPISEFDNTKYGLTVDLEQDGRIYVSYGGGATLGSAETLTIVSLTFNFSTTQPVVQSTIGIYPDETQSGILRIGSGTSDNDLSNAMLVDWGGNAYFKGDISFGCDDDSSGGTSLTKIKYVPDARTSDGATWSCNVAYFQVGKIVQLEISLDKSASTAAGDNFLDLIIFDGQLPKLVGSHATGLMYTGSRPIGIMLYYVDDVMHLQFRNLNTTALTVSGVMGSMMYMCE